MKLRSDVLGAQRNEHWNEERNIAPNGKTDRTSNNILIFFCYKEKHEKTKQIVNMNKYVYFILVPLNSEKRREQTKKNESSSLIWFSVYCVWCDGVDLNDYILRVKTLFAICHTILFFASCVFLLLLFFFFFDNVMALAMASWQTSIALALTEKRTEFIFFSLSPQSVKFLILHNIHSLFGFGKANSSSGENNSKKNEKRFFSLETRKERKPRQTHKNWIHSYNSIFKCTRAVWRIWKTFFYI